MPIYIDSRNAGAVAVALFLFGVPLAAVASTLSGHDFARLSQVVLGGLCAVACLVRPVVSPTPSLAVLSGFLAALALASAISAAQPAMAMREVALIVGGFAVVMVVAAMPNASYAWAMITSAATFVYIGVLLLFISITLAVGGSPGRTELFVGYDNHRFFNHVQTAALPMALAALHTHGMPRWALGLARLALVAGCMLLFASAGRGTFVAMVFAALIVGMLLGRRAWPVLRSLAIGLVAGLILFALIFLLIPAASQGQVPAMPDYAGARIVSDQARGYLWQLTWQQIVQSPWLGVGPMHYAHMPNTKAAHPHNVYLQIAAEWGVPMLLLAGAWVSWLFVRFVRTLRQAEPQRDLNVGIALAIGCLAVAIDGMVSGNFVMPVSQVWIAVLAGWSLAWWRGQNARTPPTPGHPTRRSLLAAAVLLSQLWLLWAVLPEAGDLRARLEQARQAFPSERTQPRFWSHGRF